MLNTELVKNKNKTNKIKQNHVQPHHPKPKLKLFLTIFLFQIYISR